MGKFPEVTVLVCTRNRPEKVGSCIASILDNTYKAFELLIVDQSTDNKTEEIIKGYINADKRIRYLHMDGQGKSRASNLGIKNSSGDIIATTDDDCVVNKDWIEKIVEAFEQNPDVGIVYGRAINKPGSSSIRNKKYSGRLSKRSFIGDGANRSIRRSIFNKVKGFDEFIGPGAPFMALEDQDFTYRALRLGFKILEAKEIIVTHSPRSLLSKDERMEAIRRNETGKGALLAKAILCFELAGILLCLISYIKTLTGLTKSIMQNRGCLKGYKPAVLLILQTWVLVAYWNLLGMIMAMRYDIDKTSAVYTGRIDAKKLPQSH